MIMDCECFSVATSNIDRGVVDPPIYRLILSYIICYSVILQQVGLGVGFVCLAVYNALSVLCLLAAVKLLFSILGTVDLHVLICCDVGCVRLKCQTLVLG